MVSRGGHKNVVPVFNYSSLKPQNDRQGGGSQIMNVTCWSLGTWWSPASSWLSRSGCHGRTSPPGPPRPRARPPCWWSSLRSTGWCLRAVVARLKIFQCYRDRGSRSEARLEINLAKSLKNNWPLKYFIFLILEMSETLINESCLGITTALDHLQNQTFFRIHYLVCYQVELARSQRVPPTRECACRDSCGASAGQRGAEDPCTGRLCAGRAACGGSGESEGWWNVRWD